MDSCAVVLHGAADRIVRIPMRAHVGCAHDALRQRTGPLCAVAEFCAAWQRLCAACQLQPLVLQGNLRRMTAP